MVVRLGLLWSKWLLCGVVCLACCVGVAGNAAAQTHQVLLESGRNQLLQQTTSGLVGAKTMLLAADAACPNMAPEKNEIKFYLALAKLGCRLFEDNGATIDTLAEVLKAYGFALQGDSFNDLTVVDTGLPSSEAPDSKLLRLVLREHIIPEIEATRDVMQDLVEADFLTVIPQDNQVFVSNIEVDKGDLLLFESGTHALLAIANLLSATDIDITRDDLRNMALSGNELSVLDTLLANSSNFLTFDKVADNIEASKAALRAIESYFAGSNYIRNEDSLQTVGAEELFSISLDMVQDEEEFRSNLSEIKASMLEARAASFAHGTRFNVNKVLVQNAGEIPTDPRKMLPEIKEGYFVLDTVGAELGSDNTLNGVLPDATEQDWREWFTQVLDGVFGFSPLGHVYEADNLTSYIDSLVTDGDNIVAIIENYIDQKRQLATFNEITDGLSPSCTKELPVRSRLIGIANGKFYVVSQSGQLDEYDISQDGQFSLSRTVCPSCGAYTSKMTKNGLYFKVRHEMVANEDNQWVDSRRLLGYDLRVSDQDNQLVNVILPSFNNFYNFTFYATPEILYIIGSRWDGWRELSKVVAVSLVEGEKGNILGEYELVGFARGAVVNGGVMYCIVGNEVVVLNITNPLQIEMITRVKPYGGGAYFNTIEMVGNTLLVAGSPMLTAFDVIDPTTPRLLAAVRYRYDGRSQLMFKDGKALIETFEGLYQLDMRLLDSDSDGLDDGWERQYFGTLASTGDQDFDQDGLSNRDEMSIGTNPKQSDTDGDGMSDGWEHKYNLFATYNDAMLDMDGDGFSNVDEFKGDADPFSSTSVPEKKNGLQPSVLMLLLN